MTGERDNQKEFGPLRFSTLMIDTSINRLVQKPVCEYMSGELPDLHVFCELRRCRRVEVLNAIHAKVGRQIKLLPFDAVADGTNRQTT